jgi:hypothetical protein
MPDPDLMRDLQYALTLPAEERRALMEGAVEGKGGGDYGVQRLKPWLRKTLSGVGGG